MSQGAQQAASPQGQGAAPEGQQGQQGAQSQAAQPGPQGQQGQVGPAQVNQVAQAVHARLQAQQGQGGGGAPAGAQSMTAGQVAGVGLDLLQKIVPLVLDELRTLGYKF